MTVFQNCQKWQFWQLKTVIFDSFDSASFVSQGQNCHKLSNLTVFQDFPKCPCKLSKSVTFPRPHLVCKSKQEQVLLPPHRWQNLLIDSSSNRETISSRKSALKNLGWHIYIAKNDTRALVTGRFTILKNRTSWNSIEKGFQHVSKIRFFSQKSPIRPIFSG